MAPARRQLHRLLGNGVGELLDSVVGATPELWLAIVDTDGDVVHASGARADEAARRRRELRARGETVGALVSSGGDPALLDALAGSLALLAEAALDRQGIARETLERYREINLLYRSTETIGASLDPADVPRLLLEEADRVIHSQAAAVLLGNTGRVPAHVKGTTEAVDELVSIAEALIGRVRETGRPDIEAWDGAASSSVLCVPVRAGESVLGVVVLARGASQPTFTAGDEKLLLGLASQAGVALERARLHEDETRRQRLDEELNVARRIQLSLLPAHLPHVDGWNFAAAYSAARQVGGDFYDFLDHALPDGRLALAIADVAGKGVPAALMMAYSRALLRAQAMAGHEPVEILQRTNRLIVQDRQTRPFLTALYADLELKTGRLTYANAGHDSPLLVSADGRSQMLDAAGVILGAFDDIELEQRELTLAPGDLVVFYTDGVTEARGPVGGFFGDERLIAAATSTRGNARTILDAIVSSVAAFTAGAEQADDVTIVVAQRNGGDMSWNQ